MCGADEVALNVLGMVNGRPRDVRMRGREVTIYCKQLIIGVLFVNPFLVLFNPVFIGKVERDD